MSKVVEFYNDGHLVHMTEKSFLLLVHNALDNPSLTIDDFVKVNEKRLNRKKK